MQDVWSIVQDPEDPGTLFAGTRPAAFYRSTDGGATWEALAAPGIRTFSEINRGPTRVTQILFDPVDRGTLWASVEIGGIYRSTDRGGSWTLLEQGLVSADVHGLAVVRNPDGSKSVLATTNKGLHRSEDNGATWTFQKLDSPWQYTRAITPSADGATIFLTNGNGPPGNTGRLAAQRRRRTHLERRRSPRPAQQHAVVRRDAPRGSAPDLCLHQPRPGVSNRRRRQRWTRLEREFGEVRALHWRPLAAQTETGAKPATWSYK